MFQRTSILIVFQQNHGERTSKVIMVLVKEIVHRFNIPGKTSFKALHPEIAAECYDMNDVDLNNILPTYKNLIIWNCHECNMTGKSSVKDRVGGKAICPYCSGKKAVPGKTSFKALYPE